MATFDREFARLLLELCRYTYAAEYGDAQNVRDKNEAWDWIRTGGLTTVEPTRLAVGDTSVARIASSAERNIVAYMGTKTQFDTIGNLIASGADWTQNVEADPVPFQLTSTQLGEGHPPGVDKDNLGGLVHRGFLEELSAVQAEVVATLLERGGRARPVYLTGHSQGGAEAALATRALLAGGFRVAATYTFAAPRQRGFRGVRARGSARPSHRVRRRHCPAPAAADDPRRKGTDVRLARPSAVPG